MAYKPTLAAFFPYSPFLFPQWPCYLHLLCLPELPERKLHLIFLLACCFQIPFEDTKKTYQCPCSGIVSKLNIWFVFNLQHQAGFVCFYSLYVSKRAMEPQSGADCNICLLPHIYFGWLLNFVALNPHIPVYYLYPLCASTFPFCWWECTNEIFTKL